MHIQWHDCSHVSSGLFTHKAFAPALHRDSATQHLILLAEHLTVILDGTTHARRHALIEAHTQNQNSVSPLIPD